MRKNNFLKFLCGVTAFALTVLSVPASLGIASAEEKQTLDVYLIAGQSNAAGYSTNARLTCSETKKTEYKTGYSNVWYHGKADNHKITAYDQATKLGQGNSTSNFGAEVGMAEIISAQNPDKQSVIIKHAAGGTYLMDNHDNVASTTYGNWCPPSMRTSTAVAGLTGKLYNEFVTLVEESVEYYQTAGYEVNLCGTFWMQGEAENGAATSEEYATHLKALITDLRTEFADVFDNDASKAPFIIGKIAPTFAGGGAGVENIRRGQDMVASLTGEYAVAQAFTVETKDYIIVDPKTNQPAEGCYDRYHFSSDDMISLGHDVAIAALNYGKPFAMVDLKGEGNVDAAYRALTGEPVTFTFTPKEHYALKKLTKNGVDVTADLVGNTYTVTETTGQVRLVAEFEEVDKYALKIVCDKNGATVSRSKTMTKYYLGEELTLTVNLKDGYSLEKVTFNGQTLTAETNGKYKIVIAAENTFEVTLKKVQAEQTPPTSDTATETPEDSSSGEETNTTEEKKGCKSTVGVFGLSAFLLVGAGLASVKKSEQD